MHTTVWLEVQVETANVCSGHLSEVLRIPMANEHGFSGRFQRNTQVRLKIIFVPCSKSLNDSNGGLNQTVRTTIPIDCYARFFNPNIARVNLVSPFVAK
jgi:hypothetical protein